MNISKENISGVKNLPGVNVTSCIVPCTAEDKYATHDSTYGKGGWREVDTIQERDAIPMERRKIGMAVRVNNENKTYILKYSTNNYCWYEENPSDVAGIINEAISQGTINVDITTAVTFDKMEEALEPFAKSVNVNTKVADLEATLKAWVESKNYLTEHQSLDALATKEELATATESLNNEINGVKNDLVDTNADVSNVVSTHANFVTEYQAEIAGIKANIVELQEAIGGGEEQSFATKDELKAVADKEVNDFGIVMENITTIADNYVQSEYANDTFATKTQVDDAAESIRLLLNGYAKSTDVLSIVQTQNYVNKEYLRGYATEFFVKDYVAAVINGKVQPGQSMPDYRAEIDALKAEIEALKTELLNSKQ